MFHSYNHKADLGRAGRGIWSLRICTRRPTCPPPQSTAGRRTVAPVSGTICSTSYKYNNTACHRILRIEWSVVAVQYLVTTSAVIFSGEEWPRAKPKSASFIWPSLANRRLAGFKSRSNNKHINKSVLSKKKELNIQLWSYLCVKQNVYDNNRSLAEAFAYNF